MRLGFQVLGCLLWILASGCGAPVAEAPSTEAPAGAGRPAVHASIHPDLSDFTFRLVGQPVDAAAETFVATRLEIRRDDEAEAVQVIENFAAEMPVAGSSGDVEVFDMNFDGYGDIRIVEFLPAGPNVPYLNWLFDPASGRFVSSPELDEIASPTFDAETRRIRSEWRDGAATYGTDIYEMIEGRPVAVRKERREYTEAGVYERTVSERRDGDWQVVEREVVRE